MRSIFIFCCVIISIPAYSQSFSINTDGSTANSSSILDVKSTSKGMLIPRMTKMQRNTIATPAKGLLIFIDDIDSVGFHYYDGTNWNWLEALGKSGWKTTGNTGTDTSLNFIGTTDNKPVRFRQNNQWLAQWNLNNGTYYIGKGAGANNSAGGIVAIGDSALAKNTIGDYNTAVGYYALKDNMLGTYNTAVGTEALSKNNNNPSYNTAVGAIALRYNVNGVASTAIGAGALSDDNSIGYNTALGFNALGSNTTGYGNISIGQNSMLYGHQGLYNVAVGNNSMFSADSCIGNVAVGSDGLKLNKGDYNVAVGVLTLSANVAGEKNTAVGYYSMGQNTSGAYNIAVGMSSLADNTTGSYSVAIGDSAGHKNTTASSNVFIGHVAGYSNQTRENLLFIGDSTGYTNVSGSDQVFIGNNAGKFHRVNSRNTFIGVDAGYSDSLGFNNTFVGHQSGYSNKGTAASTGIDNTFIGQQAGYTNTSGNLITMLGYNSDVLSTALTNATAIGANASVDTSNALVLGSISGINGAGVSTNIGIGTNKPAYTLHVVNTNAQNGGWAQGIMIENTASPIANVGEAAISFRNIAIPTGSQWNIGLNQNPNLAFNYGTDLVGGNIRMLIDTLGNVGIGTIAPTAVIDVDGTYKLGTNGTKNTALIKDTVNINVGSIAANGELDVTIALANATTNGAVSVSPAADITSGVIIAWARVSAAGTIKIRYRNLTGAAIDPPAIDYYVSVIQ